MNGAGNELATSFLLVPLGSDAVKSKRNSAGRTKQNCVLCSLAIRGVVLDQSSGISADSALSIALLPIPSFNAKSVYQVF